MTRNRFSPVMCDRCGKPMWYASCLDRVYCKKCTVIRNKERVQKFRNLQKDI